MAAFVFFDVREIRDPERLGAYRAKVFETVEHFGGRYRVLGDMDSVLEGDWTPNIPVLIEFPDSQTARAWYESDLYAPLKKDRIAAARCDGVLLGGFEHGPGT
ncbi:DUF1330 domain-containing protein [Roseibium aggregatum]|uniref:DUF1330 domain-containing protein n=1 Tax=Roseibium aggregatum TaxID=187304 RepID=UPI0025ACD5DB|nr:DUF1330 domain-containing protein [Roseibium aggregatum]WJS03215.1 DUF1330 domain-containing protein [Roseibium aggregatum]